MGLYKPGSCYSWEKLYKLIIVYYNKQNFLSEIILINAASETSNAHVFLIILTGNKGTNFWKRRLGRYA